MDTTSMALTTLVMKARIGTMMVIRVRTDRAHEGIRRVRIFSRVLIGECIDLALEVIQRILLKFSFAYIALNLLGIAIHVEFFIL